MIYQKGPVYAVTGGDYTSLADPVVRRPSPTSPLGVAPRVPILVGPEDSAVAQWGNSGFGVQGFSGTDIRRSGLSDYLRNWADSGLGKSLADISRDPSTIYTYVRFNVFSGGDGSRLLLY